jgi:hypothetical protein
LVPLVFKKRALAPVAVLSLPVLECSAWNPTAALSLPLAPSASAEPPQAVFSLPVVLDASASSPRAVLKLPDVLAFSASAQYFATTIAGRFTDASLTRARKGGFNQPQRAPAGHTFP